MKEDFLHFVWRFHRYRSEGMKTTDAESVRVKEAGLPNERDAGPDFSNATVTIADVDWYGHVEIHLKSSDWYKHKHEKDPAYNNVILHVVYEHDCDVKTKEGRVLPCLSLKNHIEPGILHVYRSLLSRQERLPCSRYIGSVKRIAMHNWFDSLAHRRLRRKSGAVLNKLIDNRGNWEMTAAEMIIRYLGLKVNAAAFEMLASHWDARIIRHVSVDKIDIEAYLLGLAGFLDGIQTEDPYVKDLKGRYAFLKKKYRLTSLPAHIWKHSRMRPASYPERRIVELAALIHGHHMLWNSLKALKDIDKMRAFLEVEIGAYWQRHYAIGKESSTERKSIGARTRDSLLINAFAPLYYAYGEAVSSPAFCELATGLWQTLPAEDNYIIREWQKYGIEVDSAWDSQACLELKLNFCNPRKCMDCNIGKSVLLEASKEYKSKNLTLVN